MAYWFIFSLILLLADSLKLISFVAEASQFLHGVCVQHAQYQEYADAVAAIVCGATPKASTLVQDIKRTGLYHVMVVSGAHLTFLAAVLTAGRQRWHRHTLPLLFVYLLTCNMQAPALRAYLFLGLSKLAVERRWNW